jgi:alkanesulfonate monooxygenase SsuD/methylene tetrahydromethanopterin reductase-like flavin-dependent oxidoreductase (luciferase family)
MGRDPRARDRAEAIGFDTVWIPDELLWRPADGGVSGLWVCVGMAGAVASAPSSEGRHLDHVGTPQESRASAKAVEMLDEISGGRFVFGRTVPGAG